MFCESTTSRARRFLEILARCSKVSLSAVFTNRRCGRLGEPVCVARYVTRSPARGDPGGALASTSQAGDAERRTVRDCDMDRGRKVAVRWPSDVCPDAAGLPRLD